MILDECLEDDALSKYCHLVNRMVSLVVSLYKYKYPLSFLEPFLLLYLTTTLLYILNHRFIDGQPEIDIKIPEQYLLGTFRADHTGFSSP
jgi:hypothetical protein